jgi:hypothetical protein
MVQQEKLQNEQDIFYSNGYSPTSFQNNWTKN